MTSTGITISITENAKSYHEQSVERVTRIEVQSQKCEDDTIFEDVTLDTAFSNSLKNSLTAIFL